MMLNILRDIKKYVLVKRILSFYLILLVFISVFFVANNIYIRNELTREYKKSNIQLLKEINKDFSSKIQFYREKMIKFTLHSEFIKSIYNLEKEWRVIDNYLVLIEKIGDMKTEYINECYLVLPKRERIVSGTAVGYYSTFLEQYQLSIETIMEESQESKDEQFISAINYDTKSEVFFITHWYRDYLILLEINKSAFNNYLSLTTSNLIGNNIIVTNGDEILLNTLPLDGTDEVKINEADEIKIGDKSYNYLIIEGGYGLVYYMLYDEASLGYILSDTNTYTILLLIGFALLIITGALIAFSHLRPIKNLFKIIEMEDSSGQNELAVIGDVLQNIKVQQENIQVELNKYYKLNENMILADNIFNEQNNQQYYIRTKHYFLLYVIAEVKGKMNNEFINLLEEELLSSHLYHKIIHYMKPQLYVIEEANRLDIMTDIQTFMEKNAQDSGFYIMSLSSIKSDIGKIRDTYNEVLKNVHWMEYSWDQNAYIIGEPTMGAKNPKFSMQDETNFVQQIFHGNEKEVQKFFDRLQDKVEGTKYMGARALYKYLLNIAYIIISNNKELSGLYNLDMDRMNKINSPNYYYNYLQEIFIEITSYFNKSEEDIISKVNAFIGENYVFSTLDLTTVADAVGLSPTYLAGYYKKETNCTIKKEIDKIRIAKSKELLRENKKVKIEDIAHQVGITNLVTFNRIFKKYEGVTPGQYRINN